MNRRVVVVAAGLALVAIVMIVALWRAQSDEVGLGIPTENLVTRPAADTIDIDGDVPHRREWLLPPRRHRRAGRGAGVRAGTMTRVPAVLLAPIVLVQGSRLRRSIPRMPPAEPRAGGSPASGALRLLVLGDSSAVGTGVEQMADALAGQLARRIPEPVRWRVVGANGLRSDEVLHHHVAEALAEPADLIVVLVGWNDALQMRSATAFGTATAELIQALQERNPAARIVLVAAPRFGRFAVYPQPLRAVLGAHVARITAIGAKVAASHGAVFVPGFDGVHVARDRFHPNAIGYGELADAVIAALR